MLDHCGLLSLCQPVQRQPGERCRNHGQGYPGEQKNLEPYTQEEGITPLGCHVKTSEAPGGLEQQEIPLLRLLVVRRIRRRQPGGSIDLVPFS
jgi:hypothetical protein